MKKLISLITSGMLAVVPAVQVQLYVYADEVSVPAVSETVRSLTDTSITETINPNKQESENPPVTTDIISNSDTDEPIVTTQAPPSADEIRAVIEYDPNDIVTLNIGEELDLNNINLGIGVWGFESESDFFEISSKVLDYKFSIGSGKHLNCYTYDTSDIDTSTAGTYSIKVNPIPNVSEKFVLENSSSNKIPNGEYEFTIQDRPFEITVEVIDPSAPVTTESNYTGITTTTTSSTIVYTKPTYTGITTITTTAISQNITNIETTVTTQAPPDVNEIRAVIEYESNDIVTLNIDEKFDLNKINLGIGVWGFDSNGEFYEVKSDELNYNFSIGSGKHSNCYTYDTNEIDTSTAGTYSIKVNPIPNISEKFVLENSSSNKIPNGEYEFTIQDRPFEITVEVIDPSAPVTTESNYTGITTTTTSNTIIYCTDMSSITTKVVVMDYLTQLEYDNSPMKIGEKRAIRLYNPATSTASGANISEVSSNISISYTDGSDIVYITALEPGDAKLYIRESSCAFGNYAYLTVNDEQFSENISTTLNITTEVTTTTTTNTTTMSNNSQTSASSTEYDANNTVMDYLTQLEYDDSPMKIGEKRAIRLYNPATGTASGANISEVSSNISISYTDGSDIVYITALEPGDAKLYIRESSCAFGNYANLTITEENNNDTNNKTPLPEQLPQTGYSDIYKWIVCFAVLIITAGTSVTIYSKKKVK